MATMVIGRTLILFTIMTIIIVKIIIKFDI